MISDGTKQGLDPQHMAVGTIGERYLFLGKQFRYVKPGVAVGAGATKLWRFKTPDTADRALLRIWVLYTVAPASLGLYEDAVINAAGTDRSADIFNLVRKRGVDASTMVIREDCTLNAAGNLIALGMPSGTLQQGLQYDCPIEAGRNTEYVLKLVDAGAGSTCAFVFEWAEVQE